MGKAPQVDLICFIGSSDAELLPSFLRHYRNLQIATFRFIVHGAWSDEQLALLGADDIVVVSRVTESFDEHVKKRWINQAADGRRGRWIVCVDADEFLLLPFPTLSRTVAVMAAMGIHDLPAVMIQRLAADGSLPPITNSDDPDAIFPLYDFRLAERLGVPHPVWKAKYPLSFVTSNFRAGRGNHLPQNGRPTAIHPLRGVVSHFKWRKSFLDTSKVARSKKSGESERAAYARFLANNRALPLDGARPFSREAMRTAGYLVAPSTRALRDLAMARRLRHSATKERDLRRLAAIQPAWPQPFAAADELLSKHHLLSRPGRVALVSPELSGLSTTGGIGTAVGALAQHLAAFGHDVHVFFCPWHGKQQNPDYWGDFWSSRGVRVHNMPRQVPGSAYEHYIPFTRRLTTALSKGAFDVIHFHDAVGYAGLPLLLRATGIWFRTTSIAVTVHGPARWHRSGDHLPWNDEEALQDHLERLAIRLADAVVLPSRAMLAHLLQTHPTERPKVLLPNCLIGETRRFGPPVDDGLPPQRVVFFGRADFRKGIDIFLEAVEIARGRGAPPFEAVVLGQFGESFSRDDLARRVAGWPEQPTVITDYSNVDAVDFLRAERCLAIVPSRVENLPYNVYECVENGIPVISTAVGGIPELFGSAAAHASTADGFAQRIETALTRGMERPRLSFRPEGAELDTLALHAGLIKTARTSATDRSPGGTISEDDHDTHTVVWDQPTAKGSAARTGLLDIAATVAATYLLLVRDGVAIESFALAALRKAAIATGADAVLCGVTWEGATGAGLEFPMGGPPEFCVRRNAFGWGVLLVRRTTFLSSGGFSPLAQMQPVAEWEFANRLLAAGQPVISIPAPLAASRRTPVMTPQNDLQRSILAAPWIAKGDVSLQGILRMALLPEATSMARERGSPRALPVHAKKIRFRLPRFMNAIVATLRTKR